MFSFFHCAGVVSFPGPAVHFWVPASGRQNRPKCKKHCSAGLEMRPFSGLHFGPPVAPKVASRRLVGLAALVAVSGARKRALSVPCHGPLASFESHGTQLVQGVYRLRQAAKHHPNPPSRDPNPTRGVLTCTKQTFSPFHTQHTRYWHKSSSQAPCFGGCPGRLPNSTKC